MADVGAGRVKGGGSGTKEAAVVVVGSAAGCGGGWEGSSRESSAASVCHEPRGLERTGFEGIFGFCDAPLARSWGFHWRKGGFCYGLGRRSISARCGLLLLLILAPDEEVAEGSFHLG